MMLFLLRCTRWLCLATVLWATLAVAPHADARRQRIRLTTLAPKDSSFHKSLMQMGQEWKRATNGQVDLIVFAGGSQGGEGAMIDRMRINQTQGALISGVGLADIDRAVAGLQKVPLFFHTLEELEYVMEEMTPEFDERIEANGFKVLAWMDSGWVRIFSKFPLRTPEDMGKGKLYTWTGDPAQTNLLQTLGFRPVPIESTDIMPSLQTGLIDIVPLPPFYALASQAYKPAPHMLRLNYVPIIAAIVVTDKVWDRIDPEHQQAMARIARKTAEEMTQAGRAESFESERVMAENWGLQIHEVDSELQSRWQNIANDAYPIIRDGTVPADVFDDVLVLLKNYRAQRASN